MHLHPSRLMAALSLLVALLTAPSTHAQTPPPKSPCSSASTTSVTSAMYSLSRSQDANECAMRVQNGSIVIAPPVTNPAMSCPDMSAWKLFAQVVTQEFWKGWAADEYTWPQSQPLRLCQSGEDPIKANCCQPGSKNNPGYDDLQNPAKFCPYFPGDFLSRYKEGAPLRFGREPSKAHLRTSGGEPVQKLLANGDPGREIRQSMAELVFRNKPMFDFVFKKNLYNQEGIAGVFTRNSANVNKGTAFHVQNTGGATVEIAFPADAIMIKSNWLNRERAEQVGLKEDPKNPYIKMNILTPVTDNNGTILKPGEHWLLAFHISSKDTPNWVWTTFEHVNNLGRCDYTGCNDSFGYRSPDKVSAGQDSNFTMPNLKCDDLLLPSWIYDTGKTYAGGDITPALQSVFNGLGIGTKDNPTLVPTSYDRAWKSYRMKGSQTEFTDSTGQPTHLGNSVTEAGFVSTSSCITCHARAGTTAKGTIPLALGVFVNELNDMGYAQSAFGVPNPAWYTASQQPPALTTLQTDFVWGFLFAACIDPKWSPACPQPPSPALLKATPAPLPLRSIKDILRRSETVQLR